MKKTILSISILLIALISCKDERDLYKELHLEEITIPEIQTAFKNGSFTAVDLTKAYLKRIEDIDKNGPAINSIIEVNPDAIAIAKQLDKERKAGKVRGPLHGIPVVLKDNIDTHDKMSTTAGARPMEFSKPLQDAFIVSKLREAGTIILGKANLSEWANFHSRKSSSGWSGLGGQTKNPFDITKNPCGSSAGSGASVSANLTVFAIGTETNGSIVCPSSANGIVGIKPTVGLLSRSGIIPISFTQDTPGPMARTVTDAAIALGTMVGIDSNDSRTAESESHFLTDYTPFLKADAIKGKRIGFYRAPMGRHEQVDSLMYQAIELLKSQGAEIIEITQISEKPIGGDSFQVLLYEFKDGLNNYFASLGPNAKVKSFDDLVEKTLADSIEMQYFDHSLLLEAQKKGDLTEDEYQQAHANLMKYSREFGIDAVMKKHQLDAFVSVTGGPAWDTDLINGDKFLLSSSSPAAMAGYPNITLPMGFINGLPVGINFFGKAWSEPTLIGLAYSYEQLTKVRKAPTL
ncbi:amidase [bacterium]|nr:MAG: amidase [bacterium]